MGNYLKIPASSNSPSLDAWYSEPAKSILYNEYFANPTVPSGSIGKWKVAGAFVSIAAHQVKVADSFVAILGVQAKVAGTFVPVL